MSSLRADCFLVDDNMGSKLDNEIIQCIQVAAARSGERIPGKITAFSFFFARLYYMRRANMLIVCDSHVTKLSRSDDTKNRCRPR